jgi:hypothetical protein
LRTRGLGGAFGRRRRLAAPLEAFTCYAAQAMAKRPRAIDDVEWDTRRPIFDHWGKLIVGVVVFVLGVLAGAGLAGWVIPPS